MIAGFAAQRLTWLRRGRVVSLVAVFALFALAFDGGLLTQAAESTTSNDHSIYQPIGAPANPKVEAHWNRYHDYADATKLIQALAAAHPERCRLQSLGKSYGQREMWVLTITNLADPRPESERPAFWIDGAIHANEIQATEVVLYTAWYLLEAYGRSELVTRLVNERVFYLMPMMSPDSRDAHMHEPNTTHSPRSGQRPVDDDNDGLIDEDKPNDLDGDGHIAQMRIRDPNGRWKSHPDFPGLMIPCKADEHGEFTLLESEGFDNDGDGRIDEDADGYYDPNRNWPWVWQPGYIQRGAHNYPFSVLECRMVGDFLMSHPNIAGAQSYHNTGGMILRGPGTKAEDYDPADVAVLNEIARKGEKMLPGYRYIETAEDLYEVYGGSTDWLYDMLGIYCFTNELFTPFNLFRAASHGGYFGASEDHHLFNKYLLFGEAFVPWHEVDHPQFGKVEVGGFKKSWMRQPPSFLLEEECHRNMAFTLYHADQMPQPIIQDVSVRPLAGGLNEVTAVLFNPKVIPTRAAVDVHRKLTQPDRVSLTGEQAKVLLGMTADDRLFRHPREQKRRPADLQIDTIGGMRAVYARWIVAGSGPYTITLRSTKGGVATARKD